MSGPPVRWLGTEIRRIPWVGPHLRSLYYASRQQVKYARGAAIQAWRELRKRRERSARSVTRRNTRAAYETLYRSNKLLGEYLQPSRLQFYDEVADICAGFTPSRVIDVGCGTGHLLAAVVERVDMALVVGVDYAESAIARARTVLPTATWQVADVYTLERAFDSQFEVVLCTEVLEHLDRPLVALERLARLRAPGGRLVLTVPDGARDAWEGHVNFWREDEFRRLLEPFGDVDLRHIDDDRTLLAIVLANVDPS